MFLTGPAAYLFTPLALAVVFAMLASYFLSRTLVPTMVLYLLPKEAASQNPKSEARNPKQIPNPHPQIQQRGAGLFRISGFGFRISGFGFRISSFHEAFNRGFERLRRAYQGLLGLALQHRLATLTLLLGFALGSLALFPHIGQDFFPSVDAGQIRLHVRAPAGTRIEETERIFGQVEDAIREIVPDSERAMILDNMGLTQSFTIMGYVDNGTVSDGDGEILVSLKPVHQPTANYIARLRQELPRRFPDCTFFFEPADITSQILNFGLPAPIDVQVVGVDRVGNLAVAQKLQKEMAKIPGIADVHLHQMTSRPDLRLDMDRVLASQLGLTAQDVAGSVLVSLSSTSQVSPNFWVNPQNRVNYRVAVQTPDYLIDSVDALMNTPIINGKLGGATGGATGGAPTSSGRQLVDGESLQRPPQLLSNLTDLRRTVSAANVNHYNVQPVFDVFANVQDRDLAAVAADVQKAIDAVRPGLPPGSTIVMRGQAETMNTSFSGLVTGLGFAVLLVYFLMVVNFQSWLDPFIILTALPGALAGILWMLYATQTTISVPALMGAIMCIGVATSNSILMVTFANDQRKGERGSDSPPMDAASAALAAGATRLRPVLMTALAMIIGMLPMSLGLGEGGEQNAPLGRAVIGGLMVATFFTLFFVPVMYSLLRRKAPAPEPEELGSNTGQQPAVSGQ